jgi:hypothetical protein
MSEEVTLQVERPDEFSLAMTFFTDDTIETVKTKIGKIAGLHPDRLRIYVQEDLPGDYYAADSRRWENLFLRMSAEGKPIRKALEQYNTLRTPPLSFQGEITKTEWMTIEPAIKESIKEYRILGLPEDRSWVIPLNNDEDPEYLPPAALVAVDQKMLFKTLHPNPVHFHVVPITEGMPSKRQLVYFPRYSSATPVLVSAEILRQTDTQDKIVRVISDLGAPRPDTSSVQSIRWKLPLVKTRVSGSVRNKFEQIFYGTTVSKETPVVSLFTSRLEQARHKFFTNDSRKKAFLDLRLWAHWWLKTKPNKSKSALVFYRGDSRESFDRVTMTSTELVVSCSRHEDEKTFKAPDLQKIAKEFLLSIDGLATFVHPLDYADERWVVQDTTVEIRYASELAEADLRRLDCLRGLFEMADPEKLKFNFLRADQTNDIGMTADELAIVQLLGDMPNPTLADVIDRIPGTPDKEAAAILARVKAEISLHPELLDRKMTNMPQFHFTAKNTLMTHANDVDRLTVYASSLRHILMHPNIDKLNDVCPQRRETVEAVVAPVPVRAEKAVAKADDDDDDDIFAAAAALTGGPRIVAPAAAPEAAPKRAKTVKATGVTTTLKNYIITELRGFDPETYDSDDPAILQKCEKHKQPIILPKDRATELKGTPYAPPDDRAQEVTDPDGLVICPEYWCTEDRIPLTKEQLDEAGGKCPVCNGKIRSNDAAEEATQSITEYPVLQRNGKHVYAGLIAYKSKKNGKQIPCCYATPQKKLKEKTDMSSVEAFYILGLSKNPAEKRLAYIPPDILRATGISVDYKIFKDAKDRIQSNRAGFFRLGMGHAAVTLPDVLNTKKPITVEGPLKNPEATIRCSFFRSWNRDDVAHTIAGHSDKVAARVASIDKAFDEGTLSVLQELEYACHVAECWAYVLFVNPEGPPTTECFMNTNTILRRDRAIAVVVYPNGSADYLCHVSHSKRKPVYNANIAQAPFEKKVRERLEELRETACGQGVVPTIENADAFIQEKLRKSPGDIRVILDPYERAQAFMLPGQIIVPFRPTSQIPPAGMIYGPRLKGYSDVRPSDYPEKYKMIAYLSQLAEIHPGYEYGHEITNINEEEVELITRSGLRIPVRGDKGTPGTPAGEIIQTVSAEDEDTLVSVVADSESVKASRAVTYEAEVFDFLLYQLSRDLQDPGRSTMRDLLADPKHNLDKLREQLADWFGHAVYMSSATDIPSFYKKLRKPCRGQGATDCESSSLCYWDGASCRVEVKKSARTTLEKPALLSRLLSTLASNDKIRSIVLDNRMSAFFSSVLYLVLPHEVILSDQDVATSIKQ